MADMPDMSGAGGTGPGGAGAGAGGTGPGGAGMRKHGLIRCQDPGGGNQWEH